MSDDPFRSSARGRANDGKTLRITFELRDQNACNSGLQSTNNTENNTVYRDPSAHAAADTMEVEQRAMPRLSPIVRTLFMQHLTARQSASTGLNSAAPLATSSSTGAGQDINGTNCEATYLARLKFAMRNTAVALDAKYGEQNEDSEALKFLKERSDMEFTMAGYRLLQKIRNAHAGVFVDERVGYERYAWFGERLGRVLMALFTSKALCRDVFADLDHTGTYLAQSPNHEYLSAINSMAPGHVNAHHHSRGAH